MNRLRIVLEFLLVAGVFFWSVQPAGAQRQRNLPRRPALSPWLNLSRGEPGPLGGYHSDVLPRLEMWRGLQQQRARLQQQNTSIRALDRRMSLVERPPELVRPTGTGSVFMNYSHYYRMRGSSRSSGRGRSWSPGSARSGGSYGGGSYGGF